MMNETRGIVVQSEKVTGNRTLKLNVLTSGRKLYRWQLEKKKKEKKECSHPSAILFVELYSAEVLIGILLIQQTDMCEWEVTSFAITLPFPLTTHINLRNLYQLTDLQEENKESTLFPIMNAS